MFHVLPSQIEKYAQDITKKIIANGAMDIIQPSDYKAVKETDFVEVDLNSLENHDVKEIGAEWIVKQMFIKFFHVNYSQEHEKIY